MAKSKAREMQWRIHTPNFLKEIIECASPEQKNGILKQPIKIFQSLLIELAERCSEINDPKLNALMCRLTLYEIADPESKDFDSKLKEEIIKNGR